MAYHTNSEIIKHVCKNLIPAVLRRYKLTKKDKKKLIDARIILLNLAKLIDEKSG